MATGFFHGGYGWEVVECEERFPELVEEVRSGTSSVEFLTDFIGGVLRGTGFTPEFVDRVLETYIDLRDVVDQDKIGAGDCWLGRMNRFYEDLWKTRREQWLKRMNEVALAAMNEERPRCMCNPDWIIACFREYAQWDDDPALFGLTSEILGRWLPERQTVRDDHKQAVRCWMKDRLEAGRFENEATSIRWRLRRPETKESEAHSLLHRLEELGEDVSAFRDAERTKLAARRLR